MTPQLLEYARIELIRALMDTSGKTKGQLQVFSENPGWFDTAEKGDIIQ